MCFCGFVSLALLTTSIPRLLSAQRVLMHDADMHLPLTSATHRTRLCTHERHKLTSDELDPRDRRQPLEKETIVARAKTPRTDMAKLNLAGHDCRSAL